MEIATPSLSRVMARDDYVGSPRRLRRLATTQGVGSFASLRTTLRVGFSLIEVLMTMALVSFLLTGMAELLLRSMQAKKAADEHLQRAGLLSSKLESFKSLSFESEGLRAGEYQEEIEGAPGEATALAEWRIEDRGFNSKRIDLRIALQSRLERRLRAVLLVSGFLGFCP